MIQHGIPGGFSFSEDGMKIPFAFLMLVPALATASTKLPGDDEFVRGDYPRAMVRYDSLLARGRDSADVLWRQARVIVCMGDVSEPDQKESYYRRAEKTARECLRIDSLCGPGHTWLSIAIGSVAMYEGGKTKVRLANEIKQHLDRAVKIDSTDDVAYSVLGTFYMALADVSWIEKQLANIFLGSLPNGGYAEAEAALKKAIRFAPGVIRHRYEIATLYREMERDAEALEEYQKSIDLPPVLASDPRTQAMARDWIGRISK
jgi:tetratricopeptide (TPR) repeat protein